MSEATASAPTLSGWALRDALIMSFLVMALYALATWHTAQPVWFSYASAAAAAFVIAYAACYMLHEWGHLLGARLAGADMPLAPYRGVAVGLFDITRHDTRQFLYLSWGGVCGYVLVTALCVALYTARPAQPVTAGLAVGSLAFVFQSLAVDLPQIFKVMRGADPLETNRRGASAAVILRRTWQSWLLLAVLLVLWNFAG